MVRDNQEKLETDKLNIFREPLPDEVQQIAKEIVDASYQIHSTLGPGLLETVYEVCMQYELSKRNIKYKSQVGIPVEYEGVKLDTGFRLDILVENQVIIELKAVEKTTSLHEAQLLTYLKLTGLRLGLLINFNVPIIKEGIRRLIL